MALALFFSFATASVVAQEADTPIIYVTQQGSSVFADGKLSILGQDPSMPVQDVDKYLNVPRMTADAAGNIYVVSYHAGTLTRYPTGGGGGTVLKRGLLGPTGIAIDRQGGMYIAEDGPWTVSYFPPGNGQPVVVASMRVKRLALDSSGNLYIAAGEDGAIYKLDVKTSKLEALVTGIHYPTGLAVDHAGNVYFSMAESDQGHGPGVYRYTPGQEKLTSMVKGGESWGIAVDDSGVMYITWYDSVYKRIPAPPGGKSTFVEVAKGLSTPGDLLVTSRPALPGANLRITSPDPLTLETVSTQRPSIQGTGAPGTAVTVSISVAPGDGAVPMGTHVCDATVNTYGNWACESTIDLARGNVWGVQAFAWGPNGAPTQAQSSVLIAR